MNHLILPQFQAEDEFYTLVKDIAAEYIADGWDEDEAQAEAMWEAREAMDYDEPASVRY